jgi:hypothetical protein
MICCDDCILTHQLLTPPQRMLARIHAFGIAKDSSAVMYGDQNRKKVLLFLDVLKGFDLILDVQRRLAEAAANYDGGAFPSRRLARISTVRLM